MTSSNPLHEKIRRLIELNGPMSVADYMAHCLLDPEHGYYMRRDPFGRAGDFVTAPEVSQMFGELIGAWLIETWRLCGTPSPVQLIELGPGRGTLMSDILRVAKTAPDFRAALSLYLVEASPLLAGMQRHKLEGQGASWHQSLAEVPAGPVLVIANEFFDALPIRQFVRSGGAWRERVIGLGAAGELVLGIGPGLLHTNLDEPDGSVFEMRPAGDALIADISQRIRDGGGAALIIDYGHAESGAGDTLQAVRGHARADPLAAPGEADLTAHVDFGALANEAQAHGIQPLGPITQREFLLSLGLLERAGRLGVNADEATRAALRAAVERLAGAAQMGTLFKVLALARPGITPPAFDRVGVTPI